MNDREQGPLMAHTVDIDAMLEWIEDDASTWRVYASDGTKKLEFRHLGGYRVKSKGEIVHQGGGGREERRLCV